MSEELAVLQPDRSMVSREQRLEREAGTPQRKKCGRQAKCSGKILNRAVT